MGDESMSADGWLKLWRKTLDSDVWRMSYHARCIFFWLLMSVNYETGELMTSYQKIIDGVSSTAGKPLTIKQVRVAIEGMKRADVVSKIGQTEGQKILHLKVLHWDKYQASQGQTSGQTEGRPPVQDRAAFIRTEEGKNTAVKSITVKSTTVEERVALAALNSAPGYKFDFDAALEFVREMIVEFPNIDVPEEIKAWRNWLRDKPLKSTSRPHAQIRNWLKRAKPTPRFGAVTSDTILDNLCRQTDEAFRAYEANNVR